MTHLLFGLIHLAHVLELDFHYAILQKMDLNQRKYPVELCKGKAGKYTAYSQVTGITKTTGQTTIVFRSTPEKPPRSAATTITTPSSSDSNSSPNSVIQNDNNKDHVSSTKTSYTEELGHASIVELQDALRQFAMDREWERFHHPRNLVLALMGEYGELAEKFQWRHDDTLMHWDDDAATTLAAVVAATSSSPTSNNNQKWMAPLSRDEVQQEIADVAIYLLRLADVCNIAIDQCALQMIATTTTSTTTT